MWHPKGIVVHHSLTEDSDTLSWGAIRRFHVDDRGWYDIGYHAGCESVRGRYEVLLGRPETMSGAHTLGKNNTHLGFCFVGNYDVSGPDPEMLATAARLWFAPILIRYNLSAERVEPHSNFSTKTCPGKLFDMDELRSMIRAAVVGQL